MDRFFMDNLNNKCPLTPRKCAKKVVIDFRRPVAHLKCFTLGKKLAYNLA